MWGREKTTGDVDCCMGWSLESGGMECVTGRAVTTLGGVLVEGYSLERSWIARVAARSKMIWATGSPWRMTCRRCPELMMRTEASRDEDGSITRLQRRCAR